MATLVRSRRARRDIVEVLRYTKERWGALQAQRYADLIEEALVAISEDPGRGKRRDDIRPGICAHHIRQPGRAARHIVFYRVNASNTVEIVRFLHDAMDFGQHVP